VAVVVCINKGDMHFMIGSEWSAASSQLHSTPWLAWLQRLDYRKLDALDVVQLSKPGQEAICWDLASFGPPGNRLPQ
jgi:hypothetical protein